jgi:hypothetical protein
MKNPALIVPGALESLQNLGTAAPLADRSDPVPDEVSEEAARLSRT